MLKFNEGSSPGNEVANAVGGQIDTSHGAPNYVDAIGENSAGGIAVDALTGAPHRHVYVADTINNRVLGWNDVSSFTSAQPANIVFGQPDLFSYKCNNGVAAGDLAGLGADSLCGPARMAVDRAGNLYVADAGNNRVLVYNTPFNAASGEPGAGDASADFVYGQGGSFTSRGSNLDGAGATTLSNPAAVALDGSGNIYIADTGNNRVLEYAKAGNPPVASDAIASRSYGQGAVNDFTDTICANGAGGNPSPSAQAMCIPGGVALDSAGNLFVADSGNNRVLEIATPLAGTQSATRVFGQGGEFTTAQCNRGEAAPGCIHVVRTGGIDARPVRQSVAGRREQRSRDRVRSAVRFGQCGGSGDRAGRRQCFHDRRLQSGNCARRPVRGGRGQLVCAGCSGGRSEYRSLRGRLGQQSIAGVRRDSRDALADRDRDRNGHGHSYADGDGDDYSKRDCDPD